MHPRGGWHDHDWRGLRNAGATFAEIERQIEMPKSYCVYLFNPERCLPLIGNSDSSDGETAVRCFKTSVSPRVRNQGAKPSSVKLGVY
jgi:hypothetical protein